MSLYVCGRTGQKGEGVTLSYRVFWHLLKGHCLLVGRGASPLEQEHKQEREVGRKWINEQMQLGERVDGESEREDSVST